MWKNSLNFIYFVFAKKITYWIIDSQFPPKILVAAFLRTPDLAPAAPEY